MFQAVPSRVGTSTNGEMPGDERELLARARAGDREAMSRIIFDQQQVVRAYLSCLAPDPTTVDDLAQEAFLILFRSLDRIDAKRGLRGYLLGIARNLARGAWRSQERCREIGGDAVLDALVARMEAAGEEEPPDGRMMALLRCLERLAPRAREVVLSHYRDDQHCAEIAARFGVVTGSIRAVLSRARAALRQCVAVVHGAGR